MLSRPVAGASLASFLLLAGCITDRPPTPPTASRYPPIEQIRQENEDAARAYVGCLKTAAVRLDDRKSDPATIALGAMSACGGQFETNVNVHSKYLEDYMAGRAKVASALRETSIEIVVGLVLENRRNRH